jgi:type IX secretion system PorP/SprF family membrane protein
MRKILLLAVLHLLIYHARSSAQVDAHFTQYYAYPLWLNPAFTGLVDGNYRVTANYRKQWPTTTAAFHSQGLTGDIALPKNFGLGLTVFRQETGDGSYQYTTGYLSLSYQVHLSQYKILSAGFQAGLLNRRVDPGKMQFGNQYNPAMGYDPTLPSNEIFAHQSASSADGSIGLLYFDGDPARSVNPFIGVSLYHPTEPNNHFLSDAGDNKVPMRFSVHGGIRLKMSGSVDLIPNAIYLSQGGASEIAGGMAINLKIDSDKDLIAGATYRVNDAIAPNIGLHINGLTIGFSYDINTSQLKTASSVNGGYELSISFTNPRKIPDARFICPRL